VLCTRPLLLSFSQVKQVRSRLTRKTQREDILDEWGVGVAPAAHTSVSCCLRVSGSRFVAGRWKCVFGPSSNGLCGGSFVSVVTLAVAILPSLVNVTPAYLQPARDMVVPKSMLFARGACPYEIRHFLHGRYDIDHLVHVQVPSRRSMCVWGVAPGAFSHAH